MQPPYGAPSPHPQQNPTRGHGVIIAACVAVGVLFLVLLVATRRPREASAGAAASKATSTAASPTASGLFEVTDDKISLWDSKESLEQSTKLAVKHDEPAFRRYHLAHGQPIERGTVVRVVTKGGLAIEVQEVGGTQRRGWIEREFLRSR